MRANWKYYEDVDFSDKNIKRFTIDTRDFYCLCESKCNAEDIKVIDTIDETKLKNYISDNFYHTEQDINDLLARFLKDSGGDGEWRILSLNSDDKLVRGWQLKYIKITRTDEGFLVCNRDNYILSKDVLSSPVNKRPFIVYKKDEV